MDIISLTFVIIFVIIIVVVFSIIITINVKKSQQKGNKVEGSSNNQLNGDGNTNITVGTINNQLILPQKEQSKQELSIDQIKSELKVIFVDDKKFNIVNLLKKNGWKQISYKNDISDLDDPEIREAHVIFLDINGVGIVMNFQNQGMGLCGAIKRKYGNKKRVVLYSGETDGSIFDSDAKMADDTLVKDSDYYQFISLMEQYGKELL